MNLKSSFIRRKEQASIPSPSVDRPSLYLSLDTKIQKEYKKVVLRQYSGRVEVDQLRWLSKAKDLESLIWNIWPYGWP